MATGCFWFRPAALGLLLAATAGTNSAAAAEHSAKLVAGAAGAAAAALDPAQESAAERSSPVEYDVDFSVVVTPPYGAKSLKVWLPIPPSDRGQEVGEVQFSTFPMQVEPRIASEPIYGNRFACFEFRDPKGAQIVRRKLHIKVWELHWNVDPAKVEAVSAWPAAFAPYRRGDTQAVKLDLRFEKLAREIVPKPGRSADDLATVMGWMHENLTYDHVDASLKADAEQVLLKRRGHCSDYHSFCAAVGRSLGCPTRVVYGLNAFPKNSPSHCKLEAFLPPYGWVSFDVSETQKMMAEIAKNPALDEAAKLRLKTAAHARLTRGFRDNTWFVQTRGTDYDVAPKGASRPPVVRTAYIEADGVPLPEPDPANKKQREFSWMTVHDYTADRPVKYPFTDLGSLETPAK